LIMLIGSIMTSAGITAIPLALFEEAPVDHTVWRVINLAVFLALMVYIFRYRLRIGKVFEDRSAGIIRELEEARKEKEEADRRLIEIESRLQQVDQEAAEIRARAEIEAAQEAERIRQAAEADSEKIKQLARREIDGAMRAARAQLRSYVAELSVGLAEDTIRRNMKPEDDARLLAEYARELGEVKK
jgi:F-type H+-transporting ATPase subunit b